MNFKHFSNVLEHKFDFSASVFTIKIPGILTALKFLEFLIYFSLLKIPNFYLFEVHGICIDYIWKR